MIDWSKPIQVTNSKGSAPARLVEKNADGFYCVAFEYDGEIRYLRTREDGRGIPFGKNIISNVPEPKPRAFDWNRPFRTRDGRKARLLGKANSRAGNYVVAVAAESGENVKQYHEDGRYYENPKFKSEADLFNVEQWRNVYKVARTGGRGFRLGHFQFGGRSKAGL